MTHAEFVAAYRAGRLTVHIDPKVAARFVSERMMLPLILLPVFGLAVGLAIAGYLWAGIALFLLAFGFRYFVRSSARGFLLTRCLESEAFFAEAVANRLLVVNDRR